MEMGTIEKEFAIIGSHEEIAKFTFSAGMLHIQFVEMGLIMKVQLSQLVVTFNSIYCVDDLSANEPNVLWTLTLHARDIDEFKCISAHYFRHLVLEVS